MMKMRFSSPLIRNLQYMYCNHKVGRVLSFSQVVGTGTPPTPHPQPSMPPPPLGSEGGAHSLAREGLGESQFRRRDIVVFFIYRYFVIVTTV
jgi:hypothetical protein